MWEEQSCDSNAEHALTINLEAYGNAASDGSASDELYIDTSDQEVQEENRKRKRSYEEGADGDDEYDEGEYTDMPEVVHEMEAEIERQLDAKAKKSNLTVANVKNILKDVITNEHVLAMVRHTMKQQETNFYFSRVFSFAPKLTRAKTRELMKTFPSIAWPITQNKKSSNSRCQVLIEQDLPEDSSDEEYQPHEEDYDEDNQGKKRYTKNLGASNIINKASDECHQDDAYSKNEDHGNESDSNELNASGKEKQENSLVSDFEFDNLQDESGTESSCHEYSEKTVESENDTFQTELSDSQCEKASGNGESDSSGAECISSVTKRQGLTINDSATQTSWSEETPNSAIIKDLEQTLRETLVENSEENIGQRTRSKFSLSDTPLETIESAFVPPDITTDMYDSECDDEDWKSFLKDFTEPLKPDFTDTPDDDEADPEYNILADEEEADDKEELRADPGVQVSRKEVNALMAELFEYIGMLSDDGELKICVCDEDTGKKHEEVSLDKSNEVLGALQENHLDLRDNYPLVPECMKISNSQKLLIDQQMRKHVQLLTQDFLLTYFHPLYHKYSIQCKENLLSLKFLGSNKPNSTFHSNNLSEAIHLVQKWEEQLSSKSVQEEYISFIKSEIEHAKEEQKRKHFYQCKFPPRLLEIISLSPVFQYPSLLPENPLRCNEPSKFKYLPSEDHLVALGLEEFLEYAQNNQSLFWNKITVPQILPFITQYMTPPRNASSLYSHIRDCQSNDSNPIGFYYKHKRAPPTEHCVIPMHGEFIKPPCRQIPELLPKVWQEYILSKWRTT